MTTTPKRRVDPTERAITFAAGFVFVLASILALAIVSGVVIGVVALARAVL